MSLLLNSAGVSAADPILKSLGLTWIIAASSMDVASFEDAWIDQSAGFAGTNSVKSSLSPAATVLVAGNAGAYNDTTKGYALGSTTGVSVDDYFYLSHGSLTPGVYKVATVVDGTHVTITGNPLNGSGNQTGIAYQIAWRFDGVAGTSPSVSSGGGTQNYYKVQVEDSDTNETQASDSNYVRDAPSGSSFIAVDGKTYAGGGTRTNDATPSFGLLSGWTNKGGVSHVALGAHSVQTGSTDFRWGDTTTSEKTLAAALSSGFSLTSGDGTKYGSLKLKSAASGVIYSVDMEIILDTTAPTITLTLVGR
jgi:hypothetical protein